MAFEESAYEVFWFELALGFLHQVEVTASSGKTESSFLFEDSQCTSLSLIEIHHNGGR